MQAFKTITRLLRLSVKLELDGWRSLYLLARRQTVAPAGARVFSYYLEMRTILFVFIGLSAVEIPIFDVVLSRWPAIRWPILILGIWGFLFMVGVYAGLKAHPHFVIQELLVVHSGPNFKVTIPKSQIDAAFVDERTFETSKGFQIDDVEGQTRVNLVTMSQTNVSLELKYPVLVTKGSKAFEVTRLDFFADDPRGLVDAL
ncbi:hypothetical protein [Rhodoluna limnophila]|uniref:hypothetical protein n=1 Tax=Rhodoluna limnophila TaxID=232537 RepID=UPI0011060112|nr:hypothetical protein [Rhodoluna limnophila]